MRGEGREHMTGRGQEELYKKIADRMKSHTNMIYTIVSGKCTGEKLYMSDGSILWESKAGAFTEEWKEILRDIKATELTEISQSGGLEARGSRIFCEKIGNGPVMVICGGGHVSVPVIRLAKSIGFYTIVLEDRLSFAGHAKDAGADEVICEPFENAMRRMEGSQDTYFVIVTRGHSYDTVCLELALQKENAYIGMMGSKKRGEIVKEQLVEKGISREALDGVYTPIGLSIKAKTPEEIAVSILAEIIEVKNRAGKSDDYTQELLSYLTGEKDCDMKKSLATIISTRGSAPRKTGTKMLVLEDGTIIGTVGGGRAEAEIINEGLRLIKQEQISNQVVTIDMTGKEAADMGMVCGGSIEVYLEKW